MPYLLNLLYLLLLLIAFPWLLWQAVRKGKYRRGYGAKFWGLVPRRTSEKTGLWFHAVSVGEVNLLAPLLKRIQVQQPDWECVVSTTTLTGMELARKKYPHLTVFYCPLDFSWAAATAMRRIRPDVLVLAELELWPNLVRAAKKNGAKVAVVNGRLGEKSFHGYRRIRRFVARMLKKLDLIAVQDETYAKRFRDLGALPETIHVTGSIKYDGAQTDRQNPATRRLAALAGITAEDAVFLAGSTQEPEEAAALKIFQRLSPEFPNLRLIIVPRHPERFETVAKLLDQSGVPWQRRTLLDHPSPLIPHPSSLPRILLVDVVGELGAWWGTAQIAFVGGSFGSRGGQNMIEPAAYGAAVSFGPNTWNFRDIVTAMLDREAAVVVNNPAELEQFVRRCLIQPDYAAELGRRAQALVQSQMGATERTLNLLTAVT
ncbi:MAG: 3-deoxy-D-manno-octulosonic acid transferase [Pirellulales bacterium]|nr:3-deoxy-D-manno-octulosonic acid transferase [Pirellulales bacterium]